MSLTRLRELWLGRSYRRMYGLRSRNPELDAAVAARRAEIELRGRMVQLQRRR